ncbi:MAG TPA: hypothetical protein VJT50_14765 [Pyrinomonadaceae bacterium]|nr:hypothetical protein [Pyrinomonadaceae bacterium]
MANDVEKILAEIRERVLAEQTASSSANGGGNLPSNGEPSTPIQNSENLRLINSHLTTTARAWDRLPPVISNRSGAIAQIELWLKRHLKRATRWYAWEQVNFNAAVHHALSDMVQALLNHEQALANQQQAITRQQQELKNLAEQSELLLRELQQSRAEFQARVAEQRSELSQVLQKLDQTTGEISTLRELNDQLRDEQRVSFKQISLEATEAAVLDDRARRKSQALLENLQARLEKLERQS